jgi:hypothetical protein
VSFADRAASSARRLVANFTTEGVLTIRDPSISTFGADLSVTLSPDSYTVPCTVPVGLSARNAAGMSVPTGVSTVYISDARLEFDPQPGMLAEFGGEQYRIDDVREYPGSVRLFLRGAATGGTASS